jgi:hypothetical protein
MEYRGQLSADGAGAVEATVQVGETALTLTPAGEAPIDLPFVDIDDLFDDNYTLRLTDYRGGSFTLTQLGKAYGQVLADVRARRDELLGHDLLLTGVDLQDTFPGKLFGGDEPMPVELRLFDDLLVVVPERGTMWGLPYSFVADVSWDETLYQVHVVADDGEAHVFGHLAKRSEEFRDELRRLLDAAGERTQAALLQLVPDAPAELGRLMRDGRAVHQRDVDQLAPALWAKLEAAVVGEALRESYEHLKEMGGGSSEPALGVKQVGGASGAEERPVMWFFCPLEGKAVAHEIASEEGHATYLYRIDPSDQRGSIARLNRALLTLNFRREPIYASAEEIESGRFQQYRVALRKLDHLRLAREAFLGRALHNETWREQLQQSLARA